MTKKTTTRRSGTTKKKRVTATRGGTGRSRRKSTARSKTTASKKRAELRLNVKQKALVVGIVLVFLTAILVLSILSPNQAVLTAQLQRLLFNLFGWGGYAVPLALAAGGFYLMLWGMEQPPRLPLLRLAGLGMLFLVFEAFATIITLSGAGPETTVWTIATSGRGGGYIGGLLAFAGIELIDTFGAVFLYLVLGVIGAVLVSGVSREDLGALVAGVVAELKERRAAPGGDVPGPATTRAATGRSRSSAQPQLPLRAGDGTVTPARSTTPAPQPAAATAEEAAPAASEKPARSSRRRRGRDKPSPAAPETAPTPVILGQGGGAPTPHWELPTVAGMLEKGSEGVVSDDAIREQTAVIEHTLESFGAPARVVDVNQGPTVTQFGVEPLFLESRGGKRTKVKVGKIAGLADDLALALAAHSVRVQAPVPGKGYVGIEVPNVDNVLVSLRDIMEAREFTRIKSSLRIGLGQNVAGKPVGTDLTKMPHLLIAGTTGSGKSVCVNGIIACLLLQNTPDDLKFVMVDPKRVELTGYNGIPHLAAPVVVEMDRVIGVLQWAMREMDNRYKRFAEAGTRNIDEYNKHVIKRGEVKLPYVVIVIDELADLMMLSPEETERGISRLAQMARATGIHMVIATQRPSVDVVTGLIKANFPARIAFAVSSGTDSRVILDQTGAERLLGRGDMLFQSPDAAAPIRLQGCFVSDRELNGIIDYWKTARRYNLITAADAQPRAALATVQEKAEQIAAENAEAAEEVPFAVEEPSAKAAGDTPVRTPKPANGAPVREKPAADVDSNGTSSNGTPSNGTTKAEVLSDLTQKQQPLWEDLIEQEKEQQWEDDLMPEAIAMVRDLGKASTSLLQRRFRIGYTRAARLIDAMEDAAIIGPPTGTSKAREVYDEAGNLVGRKGRRGSSASADGDDGDDDEEDE